jgi:hypothetical protein
MLFSQRMGITPLPENLKPDAMPDDLRNSLWNAYTYWDRPFSEYDFLSRIWGGFWKKPVDSVPVDYSYTGVSYRTANQQVRKVFFASDWSEVYDFLEFCMGMGYPGEDLARRVDAVLERESPGLASCVQGTLREGVPTGAVRSQ